MLDMTNDDLRREIQTRLEQMPPAKWVQEMIDYYHRTGTCRPEDLRRLMGDPAKGVEVGADSGLSSFLSAVRQ